MAQCPKCSSNNAEFRREHKHGEYVTVGFNISNINDAIRNSNLRF